MKREIVKTYAPLGRPLFHEVIDDDGEVTLVTHAEYLAAEVDRCSA